MEYGTQDIQGKLDALQGRGGDTGAWKHALAEAGVRVSDWDGLAIRVGLPPELASRFLTLRQWSELGFYPVIGAKRVEMHPSAAHGETFEYLHESQVEPMDAAAAMRWRAKRAALEAALARYA